MDNRIYTVADYEIYKRKAKELRRRERENAKTCGMLRCLAHDFGRMYNEVIKLYTPDKDDKKRKIKVAGELHYKAYWCRSRACRLEEKIAFSWRILKLDTRYIHGHDRDQELKKYLGGDYWEAGHDR
nr:MAG TPA: hypothetical protein [Caudoviricetes sp.]